MSTNIKKIIEEESARALTAGPEMVEREIGEIAREIATTATKRFAEMAGADFVSAMVELIGPDVTAYGLRILLIRAEGELPKNNPSPATLADVDAIFSLANAEPLIEVKRKIAELLDTFKRDRNWSDVTLYESQANAQRLMFKIAELERRVLALQGQTLSAAVKAEAKLTAQHHAEIGNNFAWALCAIKKGTAVTRRAWVATQGIPGPRMTAPARVVMEEGGIEILLGDGTHAGEDSKHLLSDDLLAEDWILASDDTAELTSP